MDAYYYNSLKVSILKTSISEKNLSSFIYIAERPWGGGLNKVSF